MKRKDKDLLLRDLFARLPYGVMVSVQGGEFESYKYPYQLTAVSKFGLDSLCKVYNPVYTPFGCPKVEDVKPYLRPMSSMTEKEQKEFDDFCVIDEEAWNGNGIKGFMKQSAIMDNAIDWLNTHHFDHRGLIEKGLAVEAPEGMYGV